MSRIVVIGNAGGGKSTLARAIASAKRLPYFEIDKLLWCPGWQPAPVPVYIAEHAKIIADEAWVIDGLGRQDTIAQRIERATEIILVDMPLWMHFWLAAERQISWSKGPILHAPAGIDQMPPTEALFRTIWEVDRAWMPQLRDLCERAEQSGKLVHRLASVVELDAFTRQLSG